MQERGIRSTIYSSVACALVVWASTSLLGCSASCPPGTVQSGSVCTAHPHDGVAGSGQDGTAANAQNAAPPGTAGVSMGAATTGSSPSNVSGAQAPSAGTSSSTSNGVAGSPGAAGLAGTTSVAPNGASGTIGAAGTSGGLAGGPTGGAGSGGSASSSKCAGGAAPSSELCDNVDNDCDGKVDEEVPPAPCGKMVGLCKQGTQACANGSLGPCMGGVQPAMEVCDPQEQDENCDGMSNEGCACTNGMTRACGTSDAGICRKGMQTCTNGVWPAECPGAIMPVAESCNGKDDDCNGQVDDSPTGCTGSTPYCQNGKCVACTDSSQCTSANECQPSVCDPATNRCVPGQLKPAGTSCKGGNVCNVVGACVACGNNRADTGENCETSGQYAFSAGTCDPTTCRITDSAYRGCSGTPTCPVNDQVWFCAPQGACSATCTSSDQCRTTEGKGECISGACAVRCSSLGSTAGCPSGLSCVDTSGLGGSFPALLCGTVQVKG
jgi:hypothetical protein